MIDQLHHSLFEKMYFNEKNFTNYKYLKAESRITSSRGFAIYFYEYFYLSDAAYFDSRSHYFINIFLGTYCNLKDNNMYFLMSFQQ